MSQKDFIKLEYSVFSKLDKVDILDIINSGIAKELRDYAETHNYEITEDEIYTIVIAKSYALSGPTKQSH